MSEYNFNVKLETKNYTIEVAESDNYGYFEHHELGEERGGGLWFERNIEGKLELMDYDGVPYLSKQVIAALREHGYIVDETFE